MRRCMPLENSPTEPGGPGSNRPFEQLFDPAGALVLAEMKKVSEKIERLTRVEVAVRMIPRADNDARFGLHMPR